MSNSTNKRIRRRNKNRYDFIQVVVCMHTFDNERWYQKRFVVVGIYYTTLNSLALLSRLIHMDGYIIEININSLNVENTTRK